MTAAIQERPSVLRNKKKTIGISLAAFIGAAAFGVSGAGVANAANSPITSGAFDVLEVTTTFSPDALEAETHAHAPATYDPSDWFVVPAGVVTSTGSLQLGIDTEEAVNSSDVPITVNVAATLDYEGDGDGTVLIESSDDAQLFDLAEASSPDPSDTFADIHDHWNWYFGDAGEYTITFYTTASGFAAGTPVVIVVIVT